MHRMPHSRRWEKQLSEKIGKPAAAAVIFASTMEYERLIVSGSPIPVKGNGLRMELKNRIYPGLALHRSLQAFSSDQNFRFELIEKLFRQDFFSGLNNGIRMINLLPNPFPFIQPVLRKMSNQPYLPGSQVIVEDSPNCFAIDIFHCFILDVLTALGAGELTRLYCKTDDWLSESLSKVHWLRTQTLAQGAPKCDFRWCRTNPSN